MWAMRITAPECLERVEIPDIEVDSLQESEVLVRLVGGGLCGSDIPKFKGAYDADEPFIGDPGVPMHEIVGIVTASRSPHHEIGDLVVGSASRFRGLAEFCIASGESLFRVDRSLRAEDAVVIQPVATVLNALRRLPSPVDDRAIVLGLGPLGLFFCHILHHRGYRVLGVDRVDRSDVARTFGVDQLVTADIHEWTERADSPPTAGVVVEAVGHQQTLLADAIHHASMEGHIVAFGLPDSDYVFPMREFYERRLTMTSGNTREWRRFLSVAQEYVLQCPELYESGITHRFHPFDAQKAFECHSRPAAGRLKVVLDATARPVSARA